MRLVNLTDIHFDKNRLSMEKSSILREALLSVLLPKLRDSPTERRAYQLDSSTKEIR